MGKVYDLEEARQKARDRAKENPPFILDYAARIGAKISNCMI
jgi:hypothetical protein